MKPADSKWKTIAESIAEQIRTGTLVPGDKVPIEEDIAERWSVSRPTAHRAIAELQRDGLVVRRRRIGTVVADRNARNTHLVALIFDRFARAFDFPQSDLLQAIQEVLGENYGIVWCDSMGDPHREANYLRKMAKETDGIICFPIADPANTPLIQNLHKAGTPIVLLDRVPEGFTGSAVVSDDQIASRTAIQKLVAAGHRRIGFFGFYKPTVSSAISRYQTYLEVMKETGVEDPSRYVRWFIRQLETEPDLFRQAVGDSLYALLHQPEPITALYCIQDSFGEEVSRRVTEFGLSIPDDIELIVVNEWPRHLLHEGDKMLRIVRRKREIGLAAANRLLALIGQPDPTSSVCHVPADLYEGDQVSPANDPLPLEANS